MEPIEDSLDNVVPSYVVPGSVAGLKRISCGLPPDAVTAAISCRSKLLLSSIHGTRCDGTGGCCWVRGHDFRDVARSGEKQIINSRITSADRQRLIALMLLDQPTEIDKLV